VKGIDNLKWCATVTENKPVVTKRDQDDTQAFGNIHR
jgi:hypothetical protein